MRFRILTPAAGWLLLAMALASVGCASTVVPEDVLEDALDAPSDVDATVTPRSDADAEAGLDASDVAVVADAASCVPGITRCTASGRREVCNASGTAYEPAPCSASQSCRDGFCVEQVCLPGSARCALGSITDREVCAPDGLAYTRVPCDPNQSCSAGACVDRVCAPGVASCIGTGATHACNPDGLGYGVTMTCPSMTSCASSTGMCAGWVCMPGTQSCSGNSVRTCNADGLGYTTSACGAMQTCSASVCTPWVCTPGTFSCTDVNTRRVCNADGLGYTLSPCAGPSRFGYACLGTGTCTARVCSPSSPGRTCVSPFAQQVCNADGLSFAAVPCGPGQTCQGGTCAVRCGDWIVGPGETCDDGNTRSGDGCSSTCASERVCIPRCRTNFDCQVTCPPVPGGGRNCCDTSTGVCYGTLWMCPTVDPDSGIIPPY